jgi:hypothetical protein
MPGRRDGPTTILLASALVVALAALVLTRAAWAGLAGAAAPFAFHDAGQPPLLLLRLAGLLLALDTSRSSPARAASACAMFVLSLVARGFLLPSLVLDAALVAAVGSVERRVVVLVDAGLVAAVVLALAPGLRPRAPEPDPRDPRAMVEYYRVRANPYEERFWALAWSRAETEAPGEGHLALASADWALGRRTQARKVLAKVRKGTGSDALRERAEAQRAAWDRDVPE